MQQPLATDDTGGRTDTVQGPVQYRCLSQVPVQAGCWPCSRVAGVCFQVRPPQPVPCFVPVPEYSLSSMVFVCTVTWVGAEELRQTEKRWR